MKSILDCSWVLLLIVFQAFLISCSTANTTPSSNQVIDTPHDPFKDFCKYHYGEYFRGVHWHIVCCGNQTLRSPAELVNDQYYNEVYAECSKKFKGDDSSDLPSGMWKAFICKMEKSKAFKSGGKFTFNELRDFITKHYPDDIKASVKAETAKCSAIDSEKIQDHEKVEKYMQCYYNAENKVCDKPTEKMENREADLKKTKDLGCPVMPGIGEFGSSIEYCCKKRSTPYPILDFPGTIYPESLFEKANQCRESFALREQQLRPEAFQEVSTPKTDDGDDQKVHTHWDTLCLYTCYMEQKNYTKDMLKLDINRPLEFYTHDFGKSMQKALKDIIEKRISKEKVFLSMDIDAEKSKPMTFTELKAKFDKAGEAEKIQYYCKFVDTINFEERRALHEYCFDEKYGDAWGDAHHSFFVAHH